MLPAREVRTQLGGCREAIRVQGGKSSSQENICWMLSIPFPIPIGYLDKLSSSGQSGDRISNQGILMITVLKTMILPVFTVTDTARGLRHWILIRNPVLRGRRREKKKMKREVFKREYVFLKEFLQCACGALVVHQDVKDLQLCAGDTQRLHQALGCLLLMVSLKSPDMQG